MSFYRKSERSKATCHIARQAIINACASVWYYPIETVKAALLVRDETCSDILTKL